MTFEELKSFIGLKAKDNITGVSGIITAVCMELDGTYQARIEYKNGEGAASLWIDSKRVEVLSAHIKGGE